jgi:hypothetical protein
MKLPETPVPLDLVEMGYLMVQLWPRLKDDPADMVARSIWSKLKAGAIEAGVEWRYGDPPPLPVQG